MGDSNKLTKYPHIKSVVLCVLFIATCLIIAGCGNGSSEVPDPQSSGEQSSEASAEQAATSVDLPETLQAKMTSGSLNLLDELDAPTELSESETEEVDRAIRAYTPSMGESLLINNAKHFYLREQLTDDRAAIYDGLYQLFSDSTNADAIISIQSETSVDDYTFMKDVRVGLLALQLDHPEFFWAFHGYYTEIAVDRPYGRDNEHIFRLLRPYKHYEKEMLAFNNAVNEFFEDIDLNADDYQIAREIHDKLIAMVTYDQAVADDDENDLAHTAYGALVENSSGEAHHAVSDGYAQAYVYLLQQAGINAAVVLGKAGQTAADAKPHAWTIVQLGGDWYEVDPTWDDQSDDWKIALEKGDNSGLSDQQIAYIQEVAASEETCEALDHYLYNVTTQQIESFVPTDLTKHVFKDGREYQLVGPSVHIRANMPARYPGYDELISLLPVATGTRYAYTV